MRFISIPFFKNNLEYTLFELEAPDINAFVRTCGRDPT